MEKHRQGPAIMSYRELAIALPHCISHSLRFGRSTCCRFFYVNIQTFLQGSYSVFQMKRGWRSNRKCIYFTVIQKLFSIRKPAIDMMPGRLICRFFGIASHYSHEFAIGYFIVCLAALSFGDIAAADDTPLDGVHSFYQHCVPKARNYFNMDSILSSSSFENSILSRHFNESANCSGLLAPINTDVTR